MACYVVGDIQGCYTEFQQLLQRMAFNPKQDRLWLVGDLVNRGPQSLEVLRWAYQHDDCCQVVLGNHDLHLLAVASGHARLHRGDTLDSILQASDREPLLRWLRERPLLVEGEAGVMVHAGLWPQWDLALARQLAREVETVLRGAGYADFLAAMYGNQPDHWSADLAGNERWRFAINVFTRMRFVSRDGRLDLQYKGERDAAPAGLLPWFALPNARGQGTRVFCGHWSALGLHEQDGVYALDTGCIWGGPLTGLCADDGRLFQVPSLQPLRRG